NHELRIILSALARPRALFSADLLLADYRAGLHGRRDHRADSPADRAHGDQQPDAAEPLRELGLQDAFEGFDRSFRRNVFRPGPAGLSVPHRVDLEPARLGPSAKRRARAVHLGLL